MGDISTIVHNFNWNYLFLVFAVFGLIAGIIALIRGIRHTVAKYVMDGILIILLLSFIRQISVDVGNIDLSSFNFQIDVQGVAYQVTTINDTIIGIIEGLGFVSSASNPVLVQLGLSVSYSIIGLAVMIVGILIIVIILGPILGDILRLILSAIFSSAQKEKKHKKHRFAAFLTAFVCGSVIGALLLSPLTSAANSISEAATQINDAQDSGALASNQFEEYQDLLDLVASYQDSAVFQAMTLGSGDSSNAIDSNLIDQVTYITLDGEKVYVSDEVANLLDMFSSVVSSITYDGTNVVVDYDQLLLPETVEGILDGLSNWQLLMQLLPIVAEIGLNSADLEDSLGFELDLSDIDWSDAMTDINDIYYQFYQAGLIDEYLLPALNGGTISSTFSLDYSKKDEVKAAVEAVGDSELISSSLSDILCGFATQSALNDGIEYISTIQSVYDSIDWSFELSNLVEFVYDLARVIGLDSISGETMTNITDEITTALDDSGKLANIKALICGGSISFEATGELSEETINSFEGLLNFQITSNGIIDIGSLAQSMLSGLDGIYDYIDEETLDEVCEEIGDSSSLSEEVGYLIDVIPDAKTLSEGDLDITSEDDRNLIKSMLENIEQSTIISQVLPGMLESVLSDDQFSDMLFGLSASDFNFDCTDDEGNSTLVQEMESILDIVGIAMDISDSISDSSDTSTMINNINIDDLKTVLVTIVSSDIINPDRSIDGSDTLVSNTNFNAMISSIFGNESLSSTGLTLPSDLSSIQWLDEGIVDGEITNLCNVFTVVQNHTDFFTSESLSVEDLDGDMIAEIFGAVGKSALLSGSLSSILNDSLAASLSDLGVTINFNSVTDWEAEAAALGAVVDRLNEIGAGTNIDTIDWVALEPNQINAILTALSKTEMLSVQKDNNGYYVDKFGELAYTLIEKAGLTDLVGDSLSADSFSTVENKYTGELKTDFSWTGTVASTNYSITVDGSAVSVTADLDTTGEIAAICDIFEQVNIVGIDAITDATASGDDLATLLKAVNQSSLFSPSIPYILDYAISSIDNITLTNGDVIDFSLINTNYLLTATNEETDDEIDKICALYNTFTDGTTLTELTGDPTDLDDSGIMALEDLLNAMAYSNVLNTVKSGEDYSFFTELFATVLHSSTLDQMITGADESSAREKVLPLIAKIDNWTFESDLTSAERSLSDDSAILNFTDALKVITTNNISLSSLTSPADINADVISEFLKAVNESRILHPAICTFFSDIFEAMDLDSYLTINGIAYRTVNTYVYEDYSDESLAYWDNEIDSLSTLFQNLKSLTSGGDLSLDNITIGDGINIYDFIGPIDQMNLLDDCKEYILYKLLNSNADGVDITDYIREFDAECASYGDTSKVAYAIRKLLMPEGHTQAELEAQCIILDGLIDDLTEISILDFNDGSTFSASIFDLMMSTFTFTYDVPDTTTSYVRGLLAQELVSGMLADNLSIVDSADTSFFNAIFFGDTAFDNDYYYFNIIEARGLEGVGSLSQVGVYGDVDFEANITEAFTLMGRSLTSTSAYAIETNADMYNALLSQTEQKTSLTKYVTADGSERLYNSRLALTLFNYYADDVDVYNSQTISESIDNWNAYVDSPLGISAGYSEADKIDFNNQSFEESGAKFITALNTMNSLGI